MGSLRPVRSACSARCSQASLWPGKTPLPVLMTGARLSPDYPAFRPSRATFLFYWVLETIDFLLGVCLCIGTITGLRFSASCLPFACRSPEPLALSACSRSGAVLHRAARAARIIPPCFIPWQHMPFARPPS